MSRQHDTRKQTLNDVIRRIVPQEPAIKATMLESRQRTSRDSDGTLTLSWHDYSCVFDEDYHVGLFYVPDALDYIQEMQEEYGIVCDDVVRYLWVWADRLIKEKVYGAIIETLCAVFATWDKRFTARTKVRRGPDGTCECYCDSIDNPGPFDMMLEALTVSTLYCHEANLRNTLFEQWVCKVSCCDSSANVLDFCLRAKCCPTDLKLYQDPLLLGAIFDAQLTVKHWECCRALLQSRCQVEYTDMIEERLIYS